MRLVIILQLVLGSMFPARGLASVVPEFELTPQSNNEISCDWLFIPRQFLSPAKVRELAEVKGMSSNISIPGALGVDAETQKLFEWGTVLIKIHGFDQAKQALGLRIRADTAVQAYVVEDRPEGQVFEVLKLGQPSAKKAKSIPQVSDRVVPLPQVSTPSAYLVIHISGWYYSHASIWRAPIIGPFASMQRDLEINRLSDVIVVGMMGIMILYFICIFLYQRSDKTSLWLALVAIIVVTRLIVTSGTLLDFICHEPSVLSFIVIRKLEFGLLSWQGYTGLAFVVWTFHVTSLQRLMLLDGALAAIISLFVFLAPIEKVNSLVVVSNVYILIHVVTAIVIAVRAAVDRRTGSSALVIGLCLVLATALHDVSIVAGWNTKSTFFLSSYGVVSLIFCQGQILAIRFNKALQLASRLSQELKTEVEIQTAEVKSILADIPQGILCIIPSFRVDLGHSSKVETMLGRRCSPDDPWHEVLFRDALIGSDQLAMVCEAVKASLGESSLNFEVNAHCLPERILLKSPTIPLKHLRLTWSAVTSKHDVIEKIIVTLNDITDDIIKAEQGERQEKEMIFIRELVNIPVAHFMKFAQSSEKLLEDNNSLILDHEAQSFEFLHKVMINMHTLKGAARTLGLKVFANALHEAETVCQSCQTQAFTEAAVQSVSQEHKKVRDIFAEYMRINDQVLGRSGLDAGRVLVDRSLMEQCTYYFSFIRRYVRDQFMGFEIGQLTNTVARSVYSDLEDIVSSSTMEIGQIAKELGKPQPKLLVDGAQIFFQERAAQAIKNGFVHILRNSMDHGIEKPDERRSQGKPDAGIIQAKVRQDGDRILVAFTDDGRGLNLDRLRSRGLELGLLTKEAALRDEDVAELIFTNLSTAEVVSQYSGRGVGMGAVRSFLRDLGGDVHLVLHHSEKAKGFCPFTLEMALSARETSNYFQEPGPESITDRTRPVTG